MTRSIWLSECDPAEMEAESPHLPCGKDDAHEGHAWRGTVKAFRGAVEITSTYWCEGIKDTPVSEPQNDGGPEIVQVCMHAVMLPASGNGSPSVTRTCSQSPSRMIYRPTGSASAQGLPDSPRLRGERPDRPVGTRPGDHGEVAA